MDFEGGNTRDLFVAKAIDEYNAVNGAVGGDKYRNGILVVLMELTGVRPLFLG